ncbi:MAG TPA: cytochrome c [Frankiaceae bacterium]|jgi:mono/diheme cytochrome c family protein|nr:cytochrome c [Frankiaceae bacterium]
MAGRPLRAARVALAAVLGVAVVLGLTIWVGSLYGANTLPGQETSRGRTGAQIYANSCVACHGRNGEGGNGEIKGPPFTTGPLSTLTFDERVEKTGRGKPLRGMPRWKQELSDEELRKVAAYTQILSGQEPDPSVEDVR